MKFFRALCCAACMVSAVCLGGAREISIKENAAKYYAHANLDRSISIGADFLGKYLPVSGMTIYSDEYIFVEVALFGPQGQQIAVDPKQFSFKINNATLTPVAPGPVINQNDQLEMVSPTQIMFGNKTDAAIYNTEPETRKPLPSDQQPPPVQPAPPQNDASGQKQADPGTLVRAAQLPAGSHALPIAGYLFFRYDGKLKKIKHAELSYKGPLGQAALVLH